MTSIGFGLRLFERYGSHPRRRFARRVSIVCTAALVATAARPALAVDATGTWSGSWTCSQRTETGLNRTQNRESTMLVTQRGEALIVAIDGTAYQGRSEDSARYPTRATGSAVRCEDAGDTCTPSWEIIDVSIRINEASGRTRIVARSAVPNAPRRCRYRFSRSSCKDPGLAPQAPAEVCGDGIVNNAPNEECDGAATGTPCDGACTAACTCPTSCTPLDVTGDWAGTWASDVTGASGPFAASLSHENGFVFGTISFPPFVDVAFSPPFVVVDTCAPAEFSTGAVLKSGVVGSLKGTATNDSIAGTWTLSDGSDHGTWQLSR